MSEPKRYSVGDRIRLIGDHPWSGSTGVAAIRGRCGREKSYPFLVFLNGPERRFNTIQAALDASKPHDTIFVLPGHLETFGPVVVTTPPWPTYLEVRR